MASRIPFARLLCLPLLASAMPSLAADTCPSLRAQTDVATVAARIASVACGEHRQWYRPFIDPQGRLAGSRVREAEVARLADGQPAWRRVIDYWRDSGLLWQTHAAADCAANGGTGVPTWCRTFVVDTPWSGAFVSWVMRQARVPGYNGSGGHVHYVRRAYRDPFGNAYRVAHPLTARPAQGDLLCYVRVPSRTYGFEGLMAELAGNEAGLNMHCDIVVASNPGGDGIAYLVGGNLFDAVTMRMIRLDANGRLSELALRGTDDAECAPEMPHRCDANRQDWAVLLQLRPEEELVALASPVGPAITLAEPQSEPEEGP